LECLLKKVVREGWPETIGRANAPIDTGSEQINRLSQGRLRTAPATMDCSWPPEDREARVLQQPPLPCAFLSRSSASSSRHYDDVAHMYQGLFTRVRGIVVLGNSFGLGEAVPCRCCNGEQGA
jgi:hypothetical protein